MKSIIQFQKAFILATLIAFLTSVVACKENAKPEDPKKVAEEHNDAKFKADKEKDAKFLVDAAELDLKEIRLGQLAQQASVTQDVKDLGKHLEQAHSKSFEKLIRTCKKEINNYSNFFNRRCPRRV
jgi:putative membrane protein